VDTFVAGLDGNLTPPVDPSYN